MKLGVRPALGRGMYRANGRVRGRRPARHAAIGLAALLVAGATAAALPSAGALAGTAGPPGSVPAWTNRAIGFASTPFPAGATNIIVNVMSICPFVDAGLVSTVGSLSNVAGDFVVDGSDTGGAGAAGEPVAGQQTLTGLAPLTVAIPAGALVTQLNVPFCDRPTPARLIGLSMSAAPTTLAPGGSVTFTYMVTNLGGATLDGVGVTDPSCSPVNYVSGDTTPDGALEAGETWIFTCTRTVSETTLETAAASGTADGATSLATASTSVTVPPEPVTPPYIVATRLASASALGVGTIGPFSSATKVPRLGQYAAVRWALSPAQAHQLVGVEIATKRADGTWGPWVSVTSRLTDTSGVAFYFLRSTRPLWVSIRGRFAGTEHLAASIAPAVQVHWR
jgi:uncharacterized repeat protein (TIGR01451 family)